MVNKKTMSNKIEPIIKDGRCLCPLCGNEVKRGVEVVYTAPPFYLYYCTKCKYNIEIQQREPFKEAKVWYPSLNDAYKQFIIEALVNGQMDLTVDHDSGKIEVCSK